MKLVYLIEEKIRNRINDVVLNPRNHFHPYTDLVLCCMGENGDVLAELVEIHQKLFQLIQNANEMRGSCNRIQGKCRCGQTHDLSLKEQFTKRGGFKFQPGQYVYTGEVSGLNENGPTGTIVKIEGEEAVIAYGVYNDMATVSLGSCIFAGKYCEPDEAKEMVMKGYF
jgi:hypothetical protein